MDLDEEEQMEMLGIQEKGKSSDGESHHERRNARKSSNEKAADHPGYMGGEAEAFLRINQSLRTLFHRRHLPLVCQGK